MHVTSHQERLLLLSPMIKGYRWQKLWKCLINSSLQSTFYYRHLTIVFFGVSDASKSLSLDYSCFCLMRHKTMTKTWE